MRIVFLVLLAAGCEVASGTVDPVDTESAVLGCDGSTELVRDDSWTVVANRSWQACEVNEDCTLVEPLCDQCCGNIAICADLRSDYVTQYGELCTGYSGGVCDCAPNPAEAQCSDGMCVVVEL